MVLLTATLIGATTVGDMVGGIIASYAANHFPPITHPDFDHHAARCFEKAAEKFRVRSDVHASLFPKVSTIEKWKEYMATEDNPWVSDELTQLWIEELLHDPLCQSLGLHQQLKSVENRLNGIEKKIDDNGEVLKQVKAIVTRTQDKAETDFKANPQYIKRYCADFGSNSTFLHFAGMDSEQTLLDYVLAEPPKDNPLPRIALYGGMQRGKSTELEHLGWQLRQSGRFIPVLYRIKYFKNLRYEDLPVIESNHLPVVLLIDALDETSEQHFCEQLSQVSLYAKHHPNVRIVVSCRSNFRRSYLLEDFKSLELLPLRHQDIAKYVGDCLGADAIRFFDQIRAYQLGDFISQPLELQTLVEAFHAQKTLPNSRSAVYRLLYENAIAVETTKGVKDALVTPEEELRCLERVAVVMLQLGKRELTEDEFRQTLLTGKEQQFDHLRYGILEKTERSEEEGGIQRNQHYISFINNALMEFAASQLLLRCKGVAEIKALTCFEGTNRITDLWFNAMLLFLEQVRSVRPELVSDLQTWLMADGKELLIHITDPAIISETQRGQIIIDFLKQCRAESRHFVAFGMEWEMQTRDMPVCLVQYLLHEWKVAATIDVNLKNVQQLTRLINWDLLKAKDPQLAVDLELQLLQNFSNPVFDGENVEIAYAALTNDYFLTEAFSASLFAVVSQRKHSADYQVMVARLSQLADATPYIDYLMDAEQALIPAKGSYHILPRESLYTAIYKVQGSDAVQKALKVVSRETFWRWADKKAMPLQAYQILVEKANQILAVKQDDALADALQKAISMYDGWNINPIQRTAEEQQRSLRLLEKEVSQLCDFIYFRGKARSWLTSVEAKGPNATLDFMELELQHALAEGSEPPNHFIIDFLQIYGSSRFDDKGTVILPAKARKVLNDESLYRRFRMRELYRFISGENRSVTLSLYQCQLCYDEAQQCLNNLITHIRVGAWTEDTPLVLSLLLDGHISIPVTHDACSALLYYVGVPITRKTISSLYDELTDDTLIQHVRHLIGDADLLGILHELVSSNCDHIGQSIDQRTMDIWTSYLLSVHHQPTMTLLTDKVAQCQTPLWPNWMSTLVWEQLNVPLLKSYANAPEVNINYLTELCDDLMSDANCHVWIRQHLESYVNYHSAEVNQKTLQMLLKTGSLSGLKLIMNGTIQLAPYLNYEFNYTDEASVPLLTEVFNIGMFRGLTMMILNSILTSLHQIALQSQANLELVQHEVVKTIQTLGPNAFTPQQWADRLTLAYLSNLQKKQAIPEILKKIDSTLN